MSSQPLIDISQLAADVFNQLIPAYSTGNNNEVLTIVSGTPTWQNVTTTSLGGIPVDITSPSNGQVLTYESGQWVNQVVTGTGTVTSISANGSLPGLNAVVTNATSTPNITLTLNSQLTGLASLTGTGYVHTTGVGTYTAQAISSSDVTTALGYTPYNASNPAGYITSSTVITLVGDVTGSGTVSSITTTLPNIASAGTYNNVTVNAKGQVTSGSNTSYLTGNQNITVTGDVTGSGTTSITLTLVTTGVTAGSYTGGWGTTTVTIPTFTVNAKGLLTVAGTVNYTRTLFTSTTQGEVSASGGGTTNFLRADGTWSAPSTNTGTVTSVAATTSSTGLTITGSPITGSGTLIFTLNTELQGLAGLGSTGFVQRTGPGAYTAAALTSSQITTALTYTPVAPGTTFAAAGGALTGGGTLSSTPSTITYTLPVFGGGSGNGAAGYVPTESVVTGTKFLRDDATWQVPPGSVTSVAASGGTTGMSFTGSPITGAGTLTLTGTLAIANGGTGQTTAANAINALLPSQTGNAGYFLTTNGTVASWAVGGGTGVTSFNTRTGAVTLSSSDVTTALGFTPISGNQSITLSGDISGSGTTAITTTLATVNSTTGTFGSSSQVAQVVVNAKGLVTSAANVTITPAAIGAPTTTGSGASGTWNINILGNAANGGVTSIVAGTGVTISGATGAVTINSTGGTVTSVGAIAGAGISITGSPITTSGTLTVTNTGVLSFSGGSTGLTPSSATTGAVTLAGTLAIANGGTGQTTAANAINALLPSQTGNSGMVLSTNGSVCSWVTVSSSSGVSSITGTANEIAASSATGAVILSLPVNLIIPTPSSGTALTVNGSGATYAALINGAGYGGAAQFSSTYANGTFCLWTNSSTINGYVGAAKGIFTGAQAVGDFGICSAGSGNLWLGNESQATPAIQIASTGNVSIVAPSSGTNVLSVAGASTSVYSTFGLHLTIGSSGGDYPSIAYNAAATTTAATYKYISSDYASAIQFNSGNITMLTAPSGTAGNTISYTQRVQLSNTGNVTIAAPSSGGPTLTLTAPTTAVGLEIISSNGYQSLTASTITFSEGNEFSSGAGEIWTSTNPLEIGTTGSASMGFWTNTVVRMGISATGNITVAAPSSSGNTVTINAPNSSSYGLQIVSNNGTPSLNASTITLSEGQVFSTGCGEIYTTTNPLLVGTTGSAVVELWTDSNPRVEVGATGTVTIVAASSGNTLTVGGNSQINSLGIGAPANGNTGDLLLSRSGGTTGAVFFGDTSNYILFDGTNFDFTGGSNIVVSGGVEATGNITAFYSSDARLKENVKPIADALAKVQQIRGVEFDWSDKYVEDNGGLHSYFLRKHNVGVIAQEIEKVLPEVVVTREDTTKAVAYERICALLIEAIKELSAKVDELENK